MTRTHRLILIGSVPVAVILLMMASHRPSPPAVGSAAPDATPPPINLQTTGALPSAPPPQIAPETRFADTLQFLAASNDKAANRQALAELRRFLEALPPQEASRAIQAFLATRQDANTQLDVTLSAGGKLADASSLRVFLLDYLGQIDPAAGAAAAAQILSQYTTPDEWAVSLRNYAWANPDPNGKAFLVAKTREMLANPAWVKNPSAGFLEAFDTIVHAGGTELTPELGALIRDKDNRATAHAAYLTLDRLTISKPADMLQRLVEQPALMEGREQTRANYVARADVRQPEQRELLERYLLDPARGAQELATFEGLYPNANYMVSTNLLTPTVTPDNAELIARDAAALQTVNAWLADPRFEKVRPRLEVMRARLAEFVRQAETARATGPAKNP